MLMAYDRSGASTIYHNSKESSYGHDLRRTVTISHEAEHVIRYRHSGDDLVEVPDAIPVARQGDSRAVVVAAAGYV